jgi:hypothetical protein
MCVCWSLLHVLCITIVSTQVDLFWSPWPGPQIPADQKHKMSGGGRNAIRRVYFPTRLSRHNISQYKNLNLGGDIEGSSSVALLRSSFQFVARCAAAKISSEKILETISRNWSRHCFDRWCCYYSTPLAYTLPININNNKHTSWVIRLIRFH